MKRGKPIYLLLVLCLFVGCGESVLSGADLGLNDLGFSQDGFSEDGDSGDGSSGGSSSGGAVDTCGDGVLDSASEDCEPALGVSQTCEHVGLENGTLSCSASCTFDTSQCIQPSTTVTITTVDGTFTHGNNVSIVGSGFGSKITARPHTYDAFDDGIVADRWHWEYGLRAFDNLFSDVTTTLRTPFSVKNARIRTDTEWNELGGGMSDTATFFATHDAPFTSARWFSSMWVKFSEGFFFEADSDGVWGNVKIFRNGGNDGSRANQYVSINQNFWGLAIEYSESGQQNLYAYDGPRPSDMDLSIWHHFQYEFQENSGNGVADGKMKFSIDGQVIVERSDVVTRTDEHPGLKHTFIPAGFQTVREAQADGEYMLFDEVYVDSSVARVAICDRESWETVETIGGHCELQIPTVWSNGSISFAVNQGSLPNGTAYLFVINDRGVTSLGKEINF